MSIIKEISDLLSKILFCNRCDFCGEVIELNECLCDRCKSLPKIDGEICVLCGYKKDDCICKKKRMEYKGIVAPYYYKDSVITAIYNFKANDMPFLSKRFGREVADTVKNRYENIDFDYITFVPLRPFHQRKRGFNQAQLIADELSKIINVDVLDTLKKSRYTGVQHYKSFENRTAQIYGSYDVKDSAKSKIIDKNILLIDDVKTTGSTLNECAKMLKIFGAKSVHCATLALTKKEKSKK